MAIDQQNTLCCYINNTGNTPYLVEVDGQVIFPTPAPEGIPERQDAVVFSVLTHGLGPFTIDVNHQRLFDAAGVADQVQEIALPVIAPELPPPAQEHLAIEMPEIAQRELRLTEYLPSPGRVVGAASIARVVLPWLANAYYVYSNTICPPPTCTTHPCTVPPDFYSPLGLNQAAIFGVPGILFLIAPETGLRSARFVFNVSCVVSGWALTTTSHMITSAAAREAGRLSVVATYRLATGILTYTYRGTLMTGALVLSPNAARLTHQGVVIGYQALTGAARRTVVSAYQGTRYTIRMLGNLRPAADAPQQDVIPARPIAGRIYHGLMTGIRVGVPALVTTVTRTVDVVHSALRLMGTGVSEGVHYLGNVCPSGLGAIAVALIAYGIANRY